MSDLNTKVYMSRDERLTLAWSILDRVGGLLTVAQASRLMGLSRGSNAYVQGILDELVHDGDAIRITMKTRRPLPTHYYGFIELSEGHEDYDEQYSKYFRQIGDGYRFRYDGAGQWFAEPRETEANEQLDLPF